MQLGMCHRSQWDQIRDKSRLCCCECKLHDCTEAVIFHHSHQFYWRAMRQLPGAHKTLHSRWRQGQKVQERVHETNNRRTQSIKRWNEFLRHQNNFDWTGGSSRFRTQVSVQKSNYFIPNLVGSDLKFFSFFSILSNLLKGIYNVNNMTITDQYVPFLRSKEILIDFRMIGNVKKNSKTMVFLLSAKVSASFI